MVTCQHFVNDYSELRDGRLDAARRAALRAHVEQCARCARYDRVLGGGVRLLREWEIEPSEQFQRRLEYRLYQEQELAAAWSRRSYGASLGAMAAIVAALAAVAWLPLLAGPAEPPLLPPVVAHAPHPVSGLPVLMRTMPFLQRVPDDALVLPSAPALFTRYAPAGLHAAPPIMLPTVVPAAAPPSR